VAVFAEVQSAAAFGEGRSAVAVYVVLQSGPAFAAASVVAASEAPRSAVVSAGVRLVEAASVAWGSQAPDSAAQFAWPASVVVAFEGAGAGVYRSQVSG
jgi:hypothetical protein